MKMSRTDGRLELSTVRSLELLGSTDRFAIGILGSKNKKIILQLANMEDRQPITLRYQRVVA